MQTLVRRTLSFAVAGAVVIGLVAGTAGAATSDAQIAKAGTIVANDLPSKWKSAPADPDSGKAIEALAAGFPQCADYRSSRAQLEEGANADSRQFTSPKDEDLSNEAWVFTSTASARKAFAAMGASTNAGCLTSLFQKAFEQQIAADPVTAGQVTSVGATIQQTSSVPDAGDDQLGYIGTVEFTLNNGSTEALLLGYFAIRTTRGIIGYTVAAPPVGAAFNDSYAKAVEDAIGKSATRMAKALKS